ncbi:MAG TPA: preprotein translocase subunit SecA [Egibacteraceae bacterium]|nr:preprotein translocase subunit SecA [Egibacteraceae bacterium]
MVLQKILRMGEGRRLRQLEKLVAEVNAHESSVSDLTDEQLRARTGEFKDRLANGETLDDLMPEAFATVREAAYRVLEQRPYDVQVLGGIALHSGEIAEMRTGEGKTLTSTMPVYLNALSGKGVHVVTVNPYLASRDAEWMGRIHRFLGLTVGLIHSQQSKAAKAEAYAADITYGTNNEFGFDFLRDHMVLSKDEMVQRGHNYAIVDEVDSILVDEARTPLIISGPADQATEWYTVFAKRVVPKLQRDVHYEIDEGKRTVAVSEEGVAKVEELLGVENLYESVNTPLIHHLNNAIRAKELYLRDREYMVADGEVLIVDEFTGRTLHGRRYSEGLHQAIEAKEGVRIKEENQTLATITLQNYFRLYDKLCGMTGTAKTEESEFAHIYKIGVVQVPTNKPPVRADQADLIYKTEKAKYEALADDIAARHEAGQPVLVGTVSIEKSERLSGMLLRRGIPHEVLNAKNHFKEAEIVAQAGRIGAVTVATNMAGRGVDIMLGGNAEALAANDARKAHDPDEEPDAYQAAYAEALERFKGEVKAEGDKVRELGGLYVLGTERHESRRIDNQLRGRSGRQGDPGESRFYLSLEDDLMRLFNASAVESIMTRLKLPEDVPIEHKMVSNAVARAQAQVESRNFEIRKNVLKYDDVMNKQREIIYAQRSTVLEGPDEKVAEYAEDFVEDTVRNLVATYAPEGVFAEEWSLDELFAALDLIYDVGVDRESLNLETIKSSELQEMLLEDIMSAYERREEELGSDVMRQVERRVILSVVDRIWREHLYEMDHLRDGIGLRAVGQRDPLVEYQREAYQAFSQMMAHIKEEATGYFFNLPVQRDEAPPAEGNGQTDAPIKRPALRDQPQAPPQRLSYTSSVTEGTTPTQPGQSSYTVGASGTSAAAGGGQHAANVAAAKPQQTVRNDSKVGRNDPCPCGSGQKYKKCHGAA